MEWNGRESRKAADPYAAAGSLVRKEKLFIFVEDKKLLRICLNDNIE